MDIAIIGAGNVGRALATAFVRAGHTVVDRLARPGGRRGRRRRDRCDASPARTPRPRRPQPSSSSPSPFAAPPTIAAEIRDVVAGKVVVDATNRMSFGADGPDIDTDDVQCRGTRRAAARRARRQGLQHAVRLEPGRPDRRGRPARWLRRRRRRRRQGDRPRARRVDRPQPGRRRARSPGRVSSRGSPSSTSPSTSPTAAAGSPAGSSSARRPRCRSPRDERSTPMAGHCAP